MKTKIKLMFTCFIMVAMVFLIACNEDEIVSPEETYEVSLKNEGEIEANRYAENLLLMYNSFKGQKSGDIRPDFYFNQMDIRTPDGQKLTFEEIEPKDVFFKHWIREFTKYKGEQLNKDNHLLQYIRIQNESMDIAFANNNMLKSTGSDFNNFIEIFQAQLLQKQKSLDKDIKIKSSQKTNSALSAIQISYKIGRVITTVGNDADGNPEYSLGHCGIFTESNYWNPNWNINSYISVGAWGNLSGKIAPGWISDDSLYHKVIKEPLAFWLNHYSATCPVNNVRILRIGNEYWVWDWGLWIRFAEASLYEHQKAAKYATAQLGKPYNYNFFDYETTNAFYCNQLVWRAWYDVDKVTRKYNIDAGILPFIVSTDIVNAADTRTAVLTSN